MNRENFGTNLQQLCEWAVACRWDDIPLTARHRAVLVLADDLAAMVAGSAEPELARYRELILSRPHIGESAIFAAGLPLADRFQAASINAVAGNWCELDEGFRKTICHAGIYVLPALLAEAQASGLTYRQVLRALTLGYEIVTRIALSFSFGHPVIHGHALWSSIGAAAGVVLAREGDAAELFGAVTAAATTASMGPRPHLIEGVLVRNGWAAAGAVNGLQSADWSACGIRGSASSIPAVYSSILGAKEQFHALNKELGVEWSVESGYHKIYACCQHGHSAVEAVLDLLEKQHIDVLQIASIDVYTHPLAITLACVDPVTTLAAKFSMPHMVAAALVYGTGGVAAFSSSSLLDPSVERLRKLVRLLPYGKPLDPPHDRPARLLIISHDGRHFEAECLSAKGGPDRPLLQDILVQKIAELAYPVLPGLVQLVQTKDLAGASTKKWADVLASVQVAQA